MAKQFWKLEALVFNEIISKPQVVLIKNVVIEVTTGRGKPIKDNFHTVR